MRTRLVTLLAILAVVLAACGKSDPKAEADNDKGVNSNAAAAAAVTVPATAGPNCTPVPSPAAAVTWLPSDFPMPAGSYVAQELPVQGSSSAKVAVFVTPLSIKDYVKFALDAFPKAGFKMGRGDSEAGEAEDSFVRGASGGSFRIRQP